jgi:hypothetical protein
MCLCVFVHCFDTSCFAATDTSPFCGPRDRCMDHGEEGREGKISNSNIHSVLTPSRLAALPPEHNRTLINCPVLLPFSSTTLFLPCPLHLTMARTSDNSHLWKQTPATNMTKAQLLALANAKDVRMKELHEKNSECRMSMAVIDFDPIQ